MPPSPAAQVQAAEPSPLPEFDTFVSRVAKYIPGEIVAAYLFLKSFVPPDAPVWIWWIVLLFLTALTAFYIWLATRQSSLPPAWTQIIISTLAFPLWVLAIGGPLFEAMAWYREYYYLPGVLLVFFTLVVGKVNA